MLIVKYICWLPSIKLETRERERKKERHEGRKKRKEIKKEKKEIL